MSKIFREGAVGALMDEYERACDMLAQFVSGLSDTDFEESRAAGGEEDLTSIRRVVRDVVRAGYGHANYLRIALSTDGDPVDVPLAAPDDVTRQLATMLAYTAETLEGRWEMPDEEVEAVRISSGWAVVYDLEQMLEQMIVHVLRHRRQIERFLNSPSP